MNKIELTQEDIKKLLDSTRPRIHGMRCDEVVRFMKKIKRY